MSPAAALAEGWALGLSTGAYCAVSCLPALVPYIMGAGEKSLPRGILIFAFFLSGRLAAYLCFALAAVLLGRLAGPLPTWVSGAAALAAGALLLSSLFLKVSGGCGAPLPATGRTVPFSLGFFTALNFCPPVAAGLLRLASLPELFSGLIYFSGFFAATALFLLPALFPVPFLTDRARSIGRLALGLSGLWLLFSGLAALV